MQVTDFNGAPGEIRTPDLMLRRHLGYQTSKVCGLCKLFECNRLDADTIIGLFESNSANNFDELRTTLDASHKSPHNSNQQQAAHPERAAD